MTGLFTAKLYAGTYSAIKAEFSKAAISEAARDPLGEKIILAPSNYIAEDLYEGLAREGGKPVFNLRAMTLLDFARRLLKHRKMLVTEIDSMTRAVLLSEVVDTCCQKLGEKSAFSRIFRKKGFVSALLRLFDEFEEGMIAGKEADSLLKSPDFLEKFPDPRKMREILSIYTAFLMRASEAGLKTRTHVVRLATDGFEVPGYPFRVRLFGFYDFTRIQWFLVEKLISSGLIDEVYFPLPTRPLEVGRMVIDDFESMQQIVPDAYRYAQNTLWQFLRQFDGNVTVLNEEKHGGKPAQRVRDMLFHKEFAGKKEALPFALISAPHGPGELRAVARLIKKEMGEKRGERKIGLVYRYLDETTVPDIERILNEFDLPFVITWSRPLIRTSPVRTLIGLAKLPFRDYPRRETVDILTSPSFDVGKLYPGIEEESPLWDHLTKKIGISKEGDWGHKLHHFISKGNTLLNRAEKDFSEDPQGDGEGSRAFLPTMREIGSAEALVHCFRELKESVEPLRTCNSFTGLAGSILDLLKRYFVVKGDEDVTRFLERVVKRTTAILKAFGELDWRGIPFTSTPSAIELLETIFQQERIPHHASGSAQERAVVIAGDIMSLRGVSFSSIYVLGANEGAWPRTKRDVSLLSDEEREIFLSTLKEPGLPPPLSRIRDNTLEEKLLFCLPFIMCEDVKALSFLRSDMSGSKRVPSPFLMDLVFRFRGPDIFFKGLTGDTVGNAFHEFPRQLRDRMHAPGYPSKREVLIASLMNIQAGGARPHLAGPAQRTVLRSTDTSYRWQKGEDLAPDPKKIGGIRIPEGKLNHTFLENYIHCPYKTFLRYGLKLEPFPEPEEVFSLGRLEMGLIVHKALFFIYRESRGDFSPDVVDRAVKRSLDEYGRNNPLGLRGLREIAFKNLSKTISDYLSWEKDNLQDFSPEMFELKFGFEEGYDVSIDISGEQVPFSGKIDRIDRNGETIQVLDYKLSTGNKYAPIEEKISLAILNQIPLYCIAARKILSARGLDVQTVIGGYIALKRDRRKGYLISALLDEGNEMYASWEKSFSLLFESLNARLFPPLADKHFKLGRFRAHYCAYCDYADICRVSPMTSGNDLVAHSLKESFARLFPGLRWHITHREGSG
jgi:hypothetical protein